MPGRLKKIKPSFSGKKRIYRSKDTRGTALPIKKSSMLLSDLIRADQEAGTGFLDANKVGKYKKKEFLAKINKLSENKGGLTLQEMKDFFINLQFGDELTIRERKKIPKFAEAYFGKGLRRFKKKDYLLSKFKQKNDKSIKNQKNIQVRKEVDDRISKIYKRAGNSEDPYKSPSDPYSSLSEGSKEKDDPRSQNSLRGGASSSQKDSSSISNLRSLK